MAVSPLQNTILSYYSGDIDRKTLREIKRRFLHVNHERLQRALSLQTSRQQKFLEILPLLLHVNHPLFPGYVSKNTPVGITDYKPDRNALTQGRMLARSFRFNPRHQSYGDIYSVFLMGSTGSVAHSNTSDLDIWICYRGDLTTTELDELKQKLEFIRRWGETLNLEVHFFLMDSERFRLGHHQDVSTEDCGSAQRYLLLDEFYRTALLLAGRFPLWWLVPPEDDAHYPEIASTLCEKRYIPDSASIDFGNTYCISAGEFIGAGMWQLYKGIDSAHKSILKICLIETYASEFPQVSFLSTEYKAAIYANKLDIDELDPYVMVYRKLERYLLQHNDNERLELIRRCFYFKINIPLSKRGLTQSWRSKLLQKLTREWHWDERMLERLDSRHRWNVRLVIQEKEALVNQLTQSYRFLTRFYSLQHAPNNELAITQQDMAILGRKLYAAFERKADKLELVNLSISSHIAEENLTFCHQHQNENGQKNDVWALYLGYLPTEQLDFHHPIKRAPTLIELLAWSHFNRLIDPYTRLMLHAGSSDLNKIELQLLVNSFVRDFPLDTYRDRLNQFDSDAYITHSTLYLNVGQDPSAENTRKGISRISMRTDPLSYSGLKDNLALTVDQIHLNSWGEIFVSHLSGPNALLNCLVMHLETLGQQASQPAPKLSVRCYCATRSQAIAERIDQLFSDVTRHFRQTERSRYIVEIDRTLHLIHLNRQQPRLESFASPDQLINALNGVQPHSNPVFFDQETDSLPVLKHIYQHIKPDRLQIFYRPGDEFTDVYLADDKGSLFYGSMYSSDENNLLSHLKPFIQSTLYRLSSDTPELNTLNLSQHIHFFKICGHERQQRIYFEAKSNEKIEWADGDHTVHAVANLDEHGHIEFSVFCKNVEFTQREYGKHMFKKVAQHIVAQRNSSQMYPCYITDLDLSGIKGKLTQGQVLSITDYFQFKFKLEQALNQALFAR